jgi:hypothetical protein
MPAARHNSLPAPSDKDRAAALEAQKKKTKVGKHPDREIIEAMLVSRSAYRVEMWLQQRYPVAADDKNTGFHISRPSLVEYRSRYLVDEGWSEPADDSPLNPLVPQRAPKRNTRWEIEQLEAAVDVQEFLLAKALQQDEEMGMMQDTTLSAVAQYRQSIKELIEAKSKLGVEGYEEVARKMQIDQHQQIDQRTVQVNVDGGEIRHEADEPDKVKIARMLMGLDPSAKKALLELEPMARPDDLVITPDDVDAVVVEDAEVTDDTASGVPSDGNQDEAS